MWNPIESIRFDSNQSESTQLSVSIQNSNTTNDYSIENVLVVINFVFTYMITIHNKKNRGVCFVRLRLSSRTSFQPFHFWKALTFLTKLFLLWNFYHQDWSRSLDLSLSVRPSTPSCPFWRSRMVPKMAVRTVSPCFNSIQKPICQCWLFHWQMAVSDWLATHCCAHKDSDWPCHTGYWISPCLASSYEDRHGNPTPNPSCRSIPQIHGLLFATHDCHLYRYM